MYGKSFAESQKLFSGLHLNWLAKYSDRINESKCSVKKRVFCLTYVSADHSSLKLCKVSVKSIKNISPALCSTAGFHKPWSPEVFPVLEPEVQLAKQIPESLALLCGHEVSWGNILVCIFILEIDLKSNISIFWSILRMTVLSLNLPMQFKCSVFESSRRLHLPWTVQKQGGFFPPSSLPPSLPSSPSPFLLSFLPLHVWRDHILYQTLFQRPQTLSLASAHTVLMCTIRRCNRCRWTVWRFARGVRVLGWFWERERGWASGCHTVSAFGRAVLSLRRSKPAQRFRRESWFSFHGTASVCQNNDGIQGECVLFLVKIHGRWIHFAFMFIWVFYT